MPLLGPLFLKVIELADEMNLLGLETLCLDGSKFKANASKHKACSYAHAKKNRKQFSQEITKLLNIEASENKVIPAEVSIQDEVRRRQKKIMVLDHAISEIELRATEKHLIEISEHNEKMKEREQKAKETGKKPRGKTPSQPVAGPSPKDQYNLTDPDSRIMPANNKGYIQGYNAQINFDAKSMLIVGRHITIHTNDKLEIKPALQELKKLPANLQEKIQNQTADAGYYSDDNIKAFEQEKIIPFIAAGRVKHNQDPLDRFKEPGPLAKDADTKTTMQHTLRTLAGKAIYSLRKQVVEQVFGIIKSVIGFREFSVRGIANVEAEWILVCIAYNIKKMFSLVEKNKPTIFNSQ
jgi:hypothetical protein